MSIETTLDRFQFLRNKNSGDKIHIQDVGDPVEEVELVRKGRQHVRVKRKGSDDTILIDMDKVVPR